MKLKDYLGKLEYFCAVVETGSFKKASERALVGQPQLSKVIQQLESVVGTELFIRSHRGVKLTPSGQQLYEFATETLRKSDEVELNLKASTQSFSGRVRIGTYDSISRYFFPEFLNYIKQVVPKVDIDLETGRSSSILKKVSSGDLDLGIVVGIEKESRRFTSEAIYEDSFGLYQAPTLDEFFAPNLIYFPFDQDQDRFARFKRSYRFKNQMLCDNLETVKALTEEGMGVGFLPHRVAREGVISRKLVSFEHPKLKNNNFDPHSISLCYRDFTEESSQTYILSELKRFLSLWSKN